MEDNEPESESSDAGELKSSGLHSPWGIIWMIIEKTGWSLHYVLWRISWVNIQMMIADAPSVKREGSKKKMTGKEAVARHKARKENG